VPARRRCHVRFASVYRNFREAKDFEAVSASSPADDAPRLATYAMIFRILEDQDAQKSRRLEGRRPAASWRWQLTLGRRGQGRTWPNPASARLCQGRGLSWAAAGPNRAAGPHASGGAQARRRGR